jgi:integrase
MNITLPPGQHRRVWRSLSHSDEVRPGDGPLFRTIGRSKRRPLTRRPLPQANAYAMIRRRAAAAGIATRLGNHSFRATGITAYLKNGGTLEKAAQMANRPRPARRSCTTEGARSSA